MLSQSKLEMPIQICSKYFWLILWKQTSCFTKSVYTTVLFIFLPIAERISFQSLPVSLLLLDAMLLHSSHDPPLNEGWILLISQSSPLSFPYLLASVLRHSLYSKLPSTLSCALIPFIRRLSSLASPYYVAICCNNTAPAQRHNDPCCWRTGHHQIELWFSSVTYRNSAVIENKAYCFSQALNMHQYVNTCGVTQVHLRLH